MRFKLVLVFLSFLALAFSGCVDDEPLDAADGDADGGASSGAPDASGEPVPERVLLASRDIPAGGISEFDVLCTFGGTDFYDLPEEAEAPDETVALEFVVRSGATTTGVQAGYERGEDITWLPIVRLSEQTFRVDVDDPDGLSEMDYKYQLNAADEEACYTGVSQGDYSIHVYALTV